MGCSARLTQRGPDHKRQGSIMFKLRDRPNKGLRNKKKAQLCLSLAVHGFQFFILKVACWMAKITKIFTVTFIFCLLLLWSEFFIYFLSEANVGIRGKAHGGRSLVELNNLSQRLKLCNMKVHKTRTCPFSRTLPVLS